MSCSRDKRSGKPPVRRSGRGGLAALATQVVEMEEERKARPVRVHGAAFPCSSGQRAS
uniref:Uncharacterized protein n=1 Tax=Setaria viridis TaxID=4556 RepID=A0A4U6VSF4_SETVI|nr:hypothetical protein SEVIR_2G129233v2 [Setaria viridis]